ncbi:MAG: PD40 domain-containing protein [Candidatus Omnitrophica bacterium]|nr:PD40 domain-containing protein [Candidatus Omnitrophota bacterium]
MNSKGFRWGIVAALILAVGASWGIQSVNQKKIENLFEGSCVICPAENASYYERVNYDLKDYVGSDILKKSGDANSAFSMGTREDDVSWLDSEGREAVEAALKKRAEQEGAKESGADEALTRLQSPTVYKDRKPSKSLQVLVPSEGAVYPPNLCAPHVEWEDPRNNLWQVRLQSGDEINESFITEKKRWRIPMDLWERLCENTDRESTLQIRGIVRDERGERAGDVQASPEIHFWISSDAADDYIVYRLVEPPFSSFKTPNIFVRNIREDEPKEFLSAQRQYCLNCHTFSSKQGDRGKLAMQVRNMVSSQYKLSVYVAVFDIDEGFGYKVQLPFEIQMSTYMAWSPDGEQLAYSANQKVAAMKPITYETQLAGMATSDLAIYDVPSNETWLVPGACDPNQLEVYPCWTPDKKSMLFARGPVGLHPSQIKYDLYQINLEGDPTPRPVEGASDNGRSNYFPRYSPDGRWLSFCQCDGGDLIRSSSDLCLMAGDLLGPSRKLECNADWAADSWHSWSSNSRWIVFASKRGGGIYAYLYLTHIDEEGRASPAVPLPIVDQPYASYNIPEFIAHVPQLGQKELFNAMRVESPPKQAQLRSVHQGISHVQEEKSEAR